jgi:Raf kinase inhibitor-like YbhB/YbcL family protein
MTEVNMTLSLSSPAFSEGSAIPKRHSGDGENLSPGLSWTESAADVQSYAVIVEDPDAPSGTFIHWVLFNIPPDRNDLPEGVAVKAEVPGVSRQGINDARISGYYGPCPPPGKPHRYFFILFALDRTLNLPAGCTAAALRQAMQNHVLDSGSLMGTYHR